MSEYTYQVRFERGQYDDEWIATVLEFPSLSYIDADRDAALAGLKRVVAGVEEDLAQEAATDRRITQSCPSCGAEVTGEPYDIGSGPELACPHCEWCWGAEGQPLRPLRGAPAGPFGVEA